MGALVLALAASGEARAMADHSGHAMMSPAMSDAGANSGVDFGSYALDGDGADFFVLHAVANGDCTSGMIADCCVMTCCSATTPEILTGITRYVVIAARPSRPTVAGGRVIVPLLEPPKRLS